MAKRDNISLADIEKQIHQAHIAGDREKIRQAKENRRVFQYKTKRLSQNGKLVRL